MRRRSFFAAAFAFLAVCFGALGLGHLGSGDGFDAGYGVVAAGQLAVAVTYLFHPSPIDTPDEPVPRRWYELASVVVGSLLLAVGVFYLVSVAL
jgi:hypothetical protein